MTELRTFYELVNFGEVVKGRNIVLGVIPANAGIQMQTGCLIRYTRLLDRVQGRLRSGAGMT